MKKQSVLISIMLCSVGLFAFSETVNFKHDLNEAKRQAGREGKLYIVEFMTERCYPCKMMDEITFAEPQVVNYIQQNYIPVKVNVESFDGFVWKEKYDIDVLPTIMVFNSQGEVVAKYEESIGSSRMFNILNEHNRHYNRIGTESYLHPAPEIPPLSPPIVEAVPSAPPPTTQTVAYTPAPTAPPLPIDAGVRNSAGAFGFQVKQHNSHSSYGVQIGAYAQHDNALRIVEQLESQFSRHVTVSTHTLHGRVVYKVVVSGFLSRIDAAGFRHQISTPTTDYFVVDLSKKL